MDKLARRLFGLVLGFFFTVLLTHSAYAGDFANLEFLQKHALQADPEVTALSQQLTELTSAKPPSKKIFVLDAISNGLFTATYYITNIPVYYALGGVAGGLFYAPYPYQYHKDKKNYEATQRTVQQLSERTQAVNTQVEALYFDWKSGSENAPEARQTLLTMTSEQVLNEIENNLRLEALLASQQSTTQKPIVQSSSTQKPISQKSPSQKPVVQKASKQKLTSQKSAQTKRP